MKILITGGAGLVGSECCRLFSERGWEVISVDNDTRGKILGNEASTKENIEKLLKNYNVQHYEIDIRDENIVSLIKKVDAIIHTAAQPSHPRSIEIPVEDFQINAWGTLHLLEKLRIHNRDCVFIFCSTNKVYGDSPNYFAYEKVNKRYSPIDSTIKDGFDESLQIDAHLHTPFGISKLTADLYAQEFATLYGLKTGIFRMGCITGGAAMAVEKHNWEPFFMKKALAREEITIFGYEGYQVRDVIHARDLSNLFYEFIKNPRPREVYNVGGGMRNSVSLLEAIDLIEEITGIRLNYKLGPQRQGDHIWWVTNLNKVKRHYPTWDLQIDIKEIFKEIYEIQQEYI